MSLHRFPRSPRIAALHCSDLWFHNFANFHQLGRPIRSTALENPVERLAHGIRIAIRDERPPSGKGVHESLFVERLDRLTNGRSADTKLLCELALCRKLISLLQSTFEDGFLYLLNNLLIKTRSLDYLIHELSSDEPVFPPRRISARFCLS